MGGRARKSCNGISMVSGDISLVLQSAVASVGRGVRRRGGFTPRARPSMEPATQPSQPSQRWALACIPWAEASLAGLAGLTGLFAQVSRSRTSAQAQSNGCATAWPEGAASVRRHVAEQRSCNPISKAMGAAIFCDRAPIKSKHHAPRMELVADSKGGQRRTTLCFPSGVC